MNVEKYVANPAALDYSYVVQILSRSYRVTSMFIHTFTNPFQGWVAIYRGSRTAWAENNSQYALFLTRFLLVSGGTSYYQWDWLPKPLLLDVFLPPGTYTFASYTVPDTTNLRWVFQLEEA